VSPHAGRPRVSLDPIAEGIDRAMAHPLGQLAARLFPKAAAEVRAVREGLPAIAAEAQERMTRHVREELGALEDEAIRSVKKMARRAFRRR
jgi:hypothetical protein